MREAAFDDFYRSTRADLLHQTFLLTGDLTAATSGTREAYVIAWHHWTKVGALAGPSGPVDWVRPLAWRLAVRRHTGRIWHRHAQVPDRQREVLDAVAALPSAQRRVLLLEQVAGLPLHLAARELGLTVAAATRRLMDAHAALAARGLPLEELGPRLGELRAVTAGTSLPRTPSVLRAGRRRRRLQTGGIVLATLGLTLAAGAVARQPAGTTGAAAEVPGGVAGDGTTLADGLLDADTVSSLVPGSTWRVVETTDNTDGDGLHTVCQQQRFADPDGEAALVRTFAAAGRPVSAVQSTELSRSEDAARTTYATVLSWFAGCTDDRVWLVDTSRVDGLTDEATILELQAPDQTTPAQTVLLARTGRTVTSVVAQARSAGTVALPDALRTLTRAVQLECAGGACTGTPTLRASGPPPAGSAPGLLAVVDLPPIRALPHPWVGTDPAPATRRNPAATTCDRTSFAGTRVPLTRTFLMPQADVPVRFGVAETTGDLRTVAKARAFVRTVEGRMDRCADKDPTTEVRAIPAGPAPAGSSVRAWAMRTEVTAEATVGFRVGLVRTGSRVAQVTFIPTEKAGWTDDQLRAVLRRCAERLREQR